MTIRLKVAIVDAGILMKILSRLMSEILLDSAALTSLQISIIHMSKLSTVVR